MKFYEYIKGENKRTSKLFGFPIYEQFSDYYTEERTQIFLNGLVTTYKINNEFGFHTEKSIKILGKTIVKRIEDGNTFEWFIAGIRVKKQALEDIYRKHYLKDVKEKYDDVYILDANSGEMFLFLTYVLNVFLKKNQSKNPLLIATKKYHIDLIKTICPEIPYIFVEKLRKNIKSDCFYSDGIRFFIAFQHSHFKKIDNALKNNSSGDVHYFKAILERLNISLDEISMKKIVIPEDDENSMLEKIKETGLNLDKFVFLAPEAVTCKSLPDKFWTDLITEYKKQGYDIFVNIMSNSNDLSSVEYKTCFLSYPEAFALARRAKKIVSLRSGFTEYLLQTGVAVDILYTGFSNRHLSDDISSKEVLAGFTVKHLPFLNQDIIREFDMSLNSCEDMLPVIVS